MRIILFIIALVSIKYESINCQPTPIPLPDCPAAVFDKNHRLSLRYYYPEHNFTTPIPPDDNRIIVYYGDGDYRNFNGEIFSFLNFNGGWAILEPQLNTNPYSLPEDGLLIIFNENICKYRFEGYDDYWDTEVFLLDEHIEFSLFEGLSNECTEDNFTCLYNFLVPNTKSYFYNKLDCKIWSGPCGISGPGSITVAHREGNLMIGGEPPTPSAFSTVTKGIIADRVNVGAGIIVGINCNDAVLLKYDNFQYPLDSIQNFIQKYGHLPGSPSGAEIESSGGFDVHSVNLDQQEKIELLYKHVAELENQIEEAKKRKR